MLFVQFLIYSTRDNWKFCQIGLAPAARTINPKLYSQSHDYQYNKFNLFE